MNGQWPGPYTGTNAGLVVLEIDDVDSYYEGIIFAYGDSEPAMIGEVKISKGQPKQKIRVALTPIERGSGALLSPEQFAIKFPNLTPPAYADSEWDISASKISIQ